jgi:hypothetical protein
MRLPSSERVFTFDYTTELGNRYEGEFTVLANLSIAKRHLCELEKTRILGGFSNPTRELEMLANILAELRTRIIKSPSWWTDSKNGYELEEEDLLVELYSRVMATEAEWRKELKEKAAQVSNKPTA